MASPETTLGYRMPIFRGIWERVKSGGALRKWWHCWAALWLGVGLWMLCMLGIWYLWIPVGCWFAGHMALIWLTQWNDRFDEMFGAQLRQRYKDRYDAA